MKPNKNFFLSLTFFFTALILIYFGITYESKYTSLFAGVAKKNTETPAIGEKLATVSVLTKKNPVLAVYKGIDIRFNDLKNRDFNARMTEVYNFLKDSIKKQVIKIASSDPQFLSELSLVVVTDEEVRTFYEQENLASRGTPEELAVPIRTHLQNQKRVLLVEAFFSKAEQSGDFALNILEPETVVSETGVEDSIVVVKPTSNVAIVEYSDYQCPFCKKIQSTMVRLKEEFPNVGFYYKHFPLPFHTEADEAAVAAECADRQGLFEAYHAVLFENQDKQFEKNLFDYARTIVPNYQKFEQCYRIGNNGEIRKKVTRHIAEGSAIGISGTPGFVVGIYDSKKKTVTGSMIFGALPIDTFRNELKKYIDR